MNILINTIKLDQDNFFDIDLIYSHIEIKIHDDIESSFVNNEVTMLDRFTFDRNPNTISSLKTFLSKSINNKFVFLDLYEGAEITKDFFRVNELIDYFKTKQLFVICTGDLPPDWDHANLDTYIDAVGNNYNIVESLNNFDNIFKDEIKPYTFLFLNRNPRDHRKKLISLLEEKDLLKNALWSDFSRSIFLPEEYEDLNSLGVGMYHKKLGQTTHEILFPNGIILSKLYRDTYFSLITEVNYNFPYSLRSEKIYKPLLAGHPFIVVSSKGYYKDLRKQGYKTFDGLIDESFDDIDDDDERLTKISDSVEKLLDSDLDQFLRESKPICEHNRLNFLERLGKKSYFSYNKLIDLFKKIKNNEQN